MNKNDTYKGQENIHGEWQTLTFRFSNQMYFGDEVFGLKAARF